jgi:iron(III) transport system permease protein
VWGSRTPAPVSEVIPPGGAVWSAWWGTVRRDATLLRREPALLLLIAGLAGALVLFVVYPLLKVFAFSVLVRGRPTLAVYGAILSKAYTRAPLVNSLKLGVTVAVSSTAIGFGFAYAVARADVPGKGIFRTLAMLPIISPPFVISLAAILLFGSRGLITAGLLRGAVHVPLYGYVGLSVVETLAYFPTAFLILVGVLGAIDPTLEDAARDLGASDLQVLRTVTVPLATPGIASALLVTFAESLADFGNPMILAGNFPVLATQAYLTITGLYDLAGGAALAVILLLPSLVAFSLAKYWVGRGAYVTVTGRPSRGPCRPPDPLLRYSSLGFCSVVSALVVLFYGMVAYGSLVRLWGVDSTPTVANYRHAFAVAWDYIRDTLVLASIATPVTGVCAMVVAFLLVRRRFFINGLFEVTSMLTFAAPGTVVGIGYILAFNQRPLLLTGTAAIIVLLFIFRNMPVGIQSGVAALAQIDVALEEAAADLGASGSRVFRDVTLPLILPAFFSALAYSFVKCVTSISAVIFVVSGSWNLITVAILAAVDNADLAQAAALSMVIIVLVLVVLGLMAGAIRGLEARVASGRGGEAGWQPTLLSSGA